MPTARESLLEAAWAAVERRPWPMVRMVEVAAAAGVSRQTLYNEFGDKAGLGAALVERQISRFLDGFAAGLASLPGHAGSVRQPARAPGGERPDGTPARAADWMADWLPRAAQRDRVVRAMLTGCPSADLPPCSGQPGQLVAELRDRALRVLAPRPDVGGAGNHDAGPELAGCCETAIRLGLSHIVAPVPGSHPRPTGTGRYVPGPPPVGRGAALPGQSPSRRSRVASSRRSE